MSFVGIDIRVFRAKSAFTLAEVLITLGIIGVVAAMTMPALIQNYKKHVYVEQLKTTVSVLNQAVKHYMADEGVDDLKNSSMSGNSDGLKKFVHKYLKVVNDCNGKYYVEDGKKCFGKYYKNQNSPHAINMSSGWWECSIVVNLANGATVCGDIADAPDTEPIPDRYAFIFLEIDTNGHKGPNEINRDFFAISVDNKGIIYDPVWVDEKRFDINDHYGGAVGKIMSEGWKMNY